MADILTLTTANMRALDSPLVFMATVCGLSLLVGLLIGTAGVAARNFPVARAGIALAGASIILLVGWLVLVAAILMIGGAS